MIYHIYPNSKQLAVSKIALCYVYSAIREEHEGDSESNTLYKYYSDAWRPSCHSLHMHLILGDKY
jgi:hypothetical protein